MRKMCGYVLVFGLLLSWSVVMAEDGFYVISVKKRNWAPVPKTGQSASYQGGDDGYYKMGVAWPNPRFTDNGDGTVTDNLTGLIWLKNANCIGTRTWTWAIADANVIATGYCGLTDGSVSGNWRLPNRFELESLLDLDNAIPALPSSHPFINVQSGSYWSSSSYFSDVAWFVNMYAGSADIELKTKTYYVWPVRGGQ